MVLVIGLLVTMLVFTVIRGITIDVFWDWFLAGDGTPFSHLGPITFWQALGLSLIVSVFVYSTTGADADAEANDGKDAVEEMVVRTFSTGVVIYAFWWIFALVIHGQIGV